MAVRAGSPPSLSSGALRGSIGGGTPPATAAVTRYITHPLSPNRASRFAPYRSVLIVLLGLINLVVYWPATLCGGRDCFGPGDADACDGIRKKPREPTGAWDDFIDAKDPSHGPMGRE